MTNYTFYCENDGPIEMFFHIWEVPRIGEKVCCPKCRSKARRVADHFNTDISENVRVSKALKVHPDELKDGSAQKMHPGATFLPNGDMVIHSRHEKLKRMKERSKADGREWVEYD